MKPGLPEYLSRTWLTVLASALICPALALSAEQLRFFVPASSAEVALTEFAVQARVFILFPYDEVSQFNTSTVDGTYSPREALEIMLRGSGLTFHFESPRQVVIKLPTDDESRLARNDLALSGQERRVSLDTIVVTARRREEDPQEIPISIAAIGADELTERNVTDLRRMNGQVPNLTIATSQFSGATGSQFRMRGLPGVVVYLDGAPMGAGALPNLVDVGRIEVLRGPQGTLFGRAAAGGAIQIVTSKPSEVFDAEVRTTFGSNSWLDVTANVSVPVTRTLFLKATGSSLQRDGYVRSTRVNTEFGSQDDKVAKADLLWRPADVFESRVQYTRIENRSSGNPYVNLGLQAVCDNTQAPPIWFNGNGQQITFAPNAYCLYTQVDLDPDTPGIQPYSTEFHSWGTQERFLNTIDVTDTRWWQIIDDVRVDATYSLSDHVTLRSITARRWGTENSFQDLDATGLDLSVNDLNLFTRRHDSRSSELQMIYVGSRLSGTTGVFWEKLAPGLQKRVNWIHNELLQVPGFIAAANSVYPNSATPVSQGGSRVSGPNQLGNAFPITRSETVQRALFSEWTLAINERLKLTAGIRYTKEDLTDYSFPPSQASNPLPPIWTDVDPGLNYFAVHGQPVVTERAPYEVWSPRLSAQYRWTPKVMAYMTYSKGSSSAGILQNPPAFTEVAPFFPRSERIKNYEVGLRSDLLNEQVRFNLTAFFNDYSDIQVSEARFPGVQITANADASVKGFELEGLFLATDALTLTYGLGWIDARYTDIGDTANLKMGTQFPLTPEFSFALGAKYRWRLGRGTLTARADYNWQDEMSTMTDRVNAILLPSTGLLSTRITYTPPVGNWEVALVGTNLTDEFRVMSAFTQPQLTAVTGFVDRPREVGLSISTRL